MLNLRSIAVSAGLALVAAPVALLAPAGAAAQQSYDRGDNRAAPHVEDFDARRVDRIEPGATLAFHLRGTPGAQAMVSIEGAQRTLALRETAPGQYDGMYTIGRGDRIGADSRVTGTLRIGRAVDTALLREPLENGAGHGRPRDHDDALAIQSFAARWGTPNEPRGTVHFGLHGTSGGRVTVHVPGADERRIELAEYHPGDYGGSYVLRPGERLDRDRPIVARLRVGDEETTVAADHILDPVRRR